jgi:catechol 2,3-dioxygenase-like lactoylglutathione lyase family enzyme
MQSSNQVSVSHKTFRFGNCQKLTYLSHSHKGGSMETQEIYRGRLIDHIQLVVRDLSISEKFYAAVFDVLGIPMGGKGDGFFWADEFCVSTRDSEAAQGILTGRHHVAFQAQNRDVVEAFYKAALANGGTDNGAPGERPYHPGYYAAFVLDPDGNNIEAVYHGEAKRSAPSVHITF